MERLRIKLDKHYEKIENRWSALPIRKQRRCFFCFVMIYLFLIAAVILSAWYDASKLNNDFGIEHIESPNLKIRDLIKEEQGGNQSKR